MLGEWACSALLRAATIRAVAHLRLLRLGEGVSAIEHLQEGDPPVGGVVPDEDVGDEEEGECLGGVVQRQEALVEALADELQPLPVHQHARRDEREAQGVGDGVADGGAAALALLVLQPEPLVAERVLGVIAAGGTAGRKSGGGGDRVASARRSGENSNAQS